MMAVEIRFTQAARKHRIGRASVRYVMATTTPAAVTTGQGNPGWRYVGPDERGRELEIIAVEIGAQQGQDPYLLVIHVMPASLRGGGTDA
jgi:hypothetical protein